MMKTKLIRVKVCPNVEMPNDSVEGAWHVGWRLPDSQTIAFYSKRQWWASTGDGLILPVASKEIALKVK